MSEAESLVVDLVVPARNCADVLGETMALVPRRLVRSVVVVDNASTDATAQVAADSGAIVVRENRVGYGAACRRGITHLSALPRKPDIVVFVPPNGSSDPSELALLLDPIQDGSAELVLGTRSKSERDRGTAVAVRLIGAIYRYRFNDVGPFRAIRFPALVALGMRDSGDGWDAEMQVKSLKLGLRIAEVAVRAPTTSQAAEPGRLTKSASAAGRTLYQILRHSTAR